MSKPIVAVLLKDGWTEEPSIDSCRVMSYDGVKLWITNEAKLSIGETQDMAKPISVLYIQNEGGNCIIAKLIELGEAIISNRN